MQRPCPTLTGLHQNVYGAPGGNQYIVITPMKSMSEIDTAFSNLTRFTVAMGADGMRKLAELSASAIEKSGTSLFAFSPNKSYIAADWIKADPEFWKRKTSAAAEKKTEEKKSEVKAARPK